MSKQILKKVQRAMALFTACMLFCMCCAVSSADAKRLVRVAFFPMDGYHVITSDGTYSGMDVEYMGALAQYADWDVEFVRCDSWDDALSQLSAGNVDLVGTAQHTDERAQLYDYANLASGYTFAAIVVNGSSTLAYEDFEAMKTAKFGMVKTYVRRADFLKFMADHGITSPQIIEYDSTADLQQALNQNEIDAAVHSFMEIQEGQRIIGRFANAEYYYITYKNNTALLNELDTAIADLKINLPTLENHLMNKYYNDKLGKEIVFTTDEKEYLSKTKSLTVGYIDGYYPFSYIEGNDMKGLAKTRLDTLEEAAGIKLKYEKINSVAEGKDKLAKGDIDILSYYTSSNDSDTENISQINYSSASLVIISMSGKKSDDIKKYASASGLTTVLETFSDIDASYISNFNDEDECLSALKHGKVDAAICNSYFAGNAINTTSEGFELRSVLRGEENVGIAISAASDPQLTEIMDKTITPADNRETNEYIVQNPLEQEFSLSTWIAKHRFKIGFLLMLIIMGILLIVLRMLHDSRRIQRLMYKDTELDVWNLNYFVYWAEQNLDAQSNYAIIYLNVAQFRIYGMLYGWKESNKLLSAVSEVLEQVLSSKHEIYARNKTPEGELYARSQGDRFVLMLEYNETGELDTRLRYIIKSLEDRLRETTGTHITINMGVYFLRDIKEDTKDAMQKSNQALDYICDKNSQSSGIQYYNEELSRQIKAQHRLEEKMANADVSKDFTVLYQAKVDIETLEVVGAEALVRYRNHNDHNDFVSPAFFIPYYETTGKVKEVDFFVFETICKMLHERIKSGKKVVPISCNFSRRHFADQDFPHKLLSMFDKYEIPRSLIEVEITETVIMEKFQQENIFNTIRYLHKEHIQLSIDDFGAGYSSLGVFEQVPASVLKLDRSFLLNHIDRNRQVEIMKQIVQLADKLHAEVVCEGVETEEDIELMKEVGAKIAQGYKFAKPESLEKFIYKVENGIK